jgi:hypothetical protein
MEMPALVNRVRSEFLEMPGLQLTLSQASRLWGLEAAACRSVIATLVDASFLRWTARGTVVRVDPTSS